MNKAWSLFWKIFGIALVIALAVSIILGLARHSGGLIAYMAQRIMVIGTGICGFIAIAVIPIELYFTDKADRAKREEASRTTEGV